MIRVYYTHASVKNSSPDVLEAWTAAATAELPLAKREQILRLRPPLSRFNSALGWQLVKFGFRSSGLPDFELSRLHFGDRIKPGWPGAIHDFNLTHSGSLLACALTDNGRIGIDVEYLRPSHDEARMFEQILSPQETPPADSGLSTFFQYWTGKEAVIKAEVSGGVWDMPEVHLQGTRGYYKDTAWRLYPLELVPGYAACVACDRVQEIRVEAVALEQLINNHGEK
jgi:4'-phosphopantetheinyl transferase